MVSWYSSKHLHNQIVIPLVVASVLVGLVATVIAVDRLSTLVRKYTSADARSTLNNAVIRLENRTDDLARGAKLLASDPRLADVLERRDGVALSGFLVRGNGALDVDNLMLLDSEGKVLSAVGDIGLLAGDSPIGPERAKYLDLSMDYPTVLRIGGLPTLTVFEPVWDSKGVQYTLAISERIDDRFLRILTRGLDAGFCLYDGSRQTIACSIDPEAGPERMLRAAVIAPDTHLETVIAEPQVTEGRLEVGGEGYIAASTTIQYKVDPTPLYVLAVLDTTAESDTTTETTRLIVFWSSIAVLVLIGLGFLVARRVSLPLTLLSEGSRKVSAGDFTTKVEVPGRNELAELADAFNQMTDSLKERTESLTRKVIELTTLREMSRAMGTTLDLDTLLESVLDSAMRMFDAESGYVMLRGRETGGLTLRAWRGAGMTRPDDVAIRSSLSEWVIREGRPLIFNPPRENEERQMADQVTGALAALCVPLVSKEGTIGAITVGSHSADFRFTSDDVRLLSTIANQMTVAVDNAELFSSLQDAYLATVRSLAAAVDAKDPYTRGHSDDVSQYSLAIADKMGLSAEQKVALEMAAYLHDIGKIGIPEGILRKPGKLTALEMKQMRHHPLIGANILSQVAFPWPIAPIVRHHHERWDGGGYPAGLRGDEIPMLARILTAADAYEAMTSDRPYRRASSESEAREELERCAGSQFDPVVIDAFLRVLRDSRRTLERVTESGPLEPQPDEARAVFVAVCDEMMANFRRLGGPRLAVNLEEELNAYFSREHLPYEFTGNHLNVAWSNNGAFDDEVRDMHKVLSHLMEGMEHVAGNSLVDHFYTQAVDGLSERLRLVAVNLDLSSLD